MAKNFVYDVFLSHSSKDKAVVRELAERLRKDGLRVWFEERKSDPAKIEEALEGSRVLVLCMSANASGAEWRRLEAGMFRFRDPLSSERRLIPLRLDDAPIKDSIGKALYVDWRAEARAKGYEKLVEACRPPRVEFTSEQRAARERLEVKALSLGHTDPIRSVVFSPDGKYALSGSDDFTLRLWEIESGRCLRVLEGHSQRIWSVAFSPEGKRALSGSDDNTLRLWDLEDGRCLRVLEGHFQRIWSVAFSPEGNRALSGSMDSTLRLWDLEDGRCLRVLEGHSQRIWSVAFSPEGNRALSSSDDNTLQLWDLKDGRCLRVLRGHSQRVWTVAFSPKENHALSGSWGNTLRLWNLEDGRCLRVLKGHSQSILSVAFDPEGNRALSGSDDNTLRLWGLEDGRCLRVLEGHSQSILSVTFSPAGNGALSASLDNTLRLWNLEDGRCMRVLEGHSQRIESVVFSPERKRALSGSWDNTLRLWSLEDGRCLRVLEGHSQRIWSVAFSPEGKRALSGSDDNTLRLWDLEDGRCLRVLEGHFQRVWSVAFSPEGNRALSGSMDSTLRLWDLEDGRCLRVLEGHPQRIGNVAFSPEGSRALSCPGDNTLRLWDLEDGCCLRVLEGHSQRILSVAFSPRGNRALSGSLDNTLRLWDLENGRCLRVLEGHFQSVWSVAFSPEGNRALSGSNDNTLRLWDLEDGRCLRVLEGHSQRIWSVAFSPEGKRALSGSDDNTLRLWNIEDGRCLRVLEGHSQRILSVAFSSDGSNVLSSAENGVTRVWDIALSAQEHRNVVKESADWEEAQVQYTNAKVLLVGESGAGKTGLSMRLALRNWQPSDSTVGAWATQWKLPVSADNGVEREIWLWDFGGQADQRLIHQLYMQDTAVAVLVFDGQKQDLFDTLDQWDRDLARVSRKPFTKMLVAGRVDAGGLRVSRRHVETFIKERGFTCFLETSAKQDIGCYELENAILDGIRWEDISWRSSPLLFKRLKDEIIRLKDEDRVLMRLNELRDALRLRLTGGEMAFKDEELKAVVGLLAGPGVVWELKFGSWILLQPERINAYAQAVIQTVREDKLERGCIAEDRVLAGDLTYHSSLRRLPSEEERIVLLAMHQALIEQGLCLREPAEKGTLLIFPSYYRRERSDLVGHPAVLVSYRFSGFLDDVYATLVVRLHHTAPFEHDQLWRYAADFKTLTGKQLGVKLTRRAEGAGELEVYFDPTIPLEEKIIFSRYVHEHLIQKAQDVERLRHYVCPHCGTPVGNPEIPMRKLAEGKKDIPCVSCDLPEKRILLWDEMEDLFASPAMKQKVRVLQDQSAIELDNESKERALVGDVISTVALAGQISRELTVSDHGIDMEIELKSDRHEATGQKLYLQLKSGDSYLRERKHDGTEIFVIRDERHVRYWMDQAFPVLLVIRSSDGEVRWMEIREYLKRESNNGKKQVKQIIFTGERFDVMSVRRWRERILTQRFA